MTNRKLSREFKIILWAIRSKDHQTEKVFPEEKDKIDWEILRTLSMQHGILPILYKQLKKLKKGQIPSKELLKFKYLFLNILHHNLIHGNNLIKFLKIFEKKGITVIPFKGPILSIQAYGDLGYRVFVDLDILISPKDFYRVYDIMTNEDFPPITPLSKKKKKYWHRTKRDFEFFALNTTIDFHQRISQAHYSFELSENEMKEQNFIHLLNHKIRILSPENTVLSICIHSTKDQWDSIKMISDLSYFLHYHPELDWNKLITKAKKMGILRMVLTGFLLAFELVDESLPEKISQMIQKDPVIHQLAKKYKTRIFARDTDHRTLYRISSITRSLDSPLHKLRYLLYFYFSPTPSDFNFITLHEFLYPLYYIIRPVRLILSLIIGLANKILNKK